MKKCALCGLTLFVHPNGVEECLPCGNVERVLGENREVVGHWIAAVVRYQLEKEFAAWPAEQARREDPVRALDSLS